MGILDRAEDDARYISTRDIGYPEYLLGYIGKSKAQCQSRYRDTSCVGVFFVNPGKYLVADKTYAYSQCKEGNG